MPLTPHTERHFAAGSSVRDVVIGMADGLTVPFALAAGLTGAVASSGLILTAGMAEIAAGSIAMGLGAYLAARGDAEHYASEKRREEQEIIEKPEVEKQEIRQVFLSYGLEGASVEELVKSLSQRPHAWAEFMMRFELGLEKPDPRRARISAATIAGAYIVGGAIPLIPYVLVAQAGQALPFSVGCTGAALTAFGYLKARFIGAPALRSAIQTVAVGGLAASVAFVLARWVS